MEEEQIQKRFGDFADYYRSFLNMSDEELRIHIANLARKLGYNKNDHAKMRREQDAHENAYEHKLKSPPPSLPI